jgi:hypothetical protein
MALSEDEAQSLMTQLLGGNRDVTLYPFEFGWVATPVLREEEIRAGRSVGQGNFIVDRTGVVTAHTSLPIPMIMEDYAAERRKGRITGRQVWPRTEGNFNP